MTKVSFAQFFIVALVLSAVYVWPRAEAERLCSQFTEYQKCTDEACVAKCKSNHGSFFAYAVCAPVYNTGQFLCQCYYHC